MIFLFVQQKILPNCSVIDYAKECKPEPQKKEIYIVFSMKMLSIFFCLKVNNNWFLRKGVFEQQTPIRCLFAILGH